MSRYTQKVSSEKIIKKTSIQKPKPSSVRVSKKSTSDLLNENSRIIDMREYIRQNRDKIKKKKIPTKKSEIWSMILEFIPPDNYKISKPTGSKPTGSKPSSSKPTSSKPSLKSKSPEKGGDCIERSKLPLKDWQKEVVEFMKNNDALLVVHETGCGKTLTAIAASQCYLDEYPNRNVIFVGPASLTSNFQKEMKAYDVKNSDKYIFYSFEKFLSLAKENKKQMNCCNNFLIVDEAHNLRNPLSERMNSVFICSIKADKKLLLTATPFVNSYVDFEPLINMIYGRNVIGGKINFSTYKKPNEKKDLEIIETYLYKKVHYKKKSCENFPERRDHVISIEMSKSFYKKYEKIIDEREVFENPEVFANGYRRAVNSLGTEYYFSVKIEKSIEILKNGKSIIYTNWIDFGIKPIAHVLKKNKITHEFFTGKTPKKDRQKIVDDFNENKFDVLVITKAGGEGLDLKGVRNVILLDPTWNFSGIEQVVGRAIRYKSHEHLSEDERYVDVYNMLLVTPKNSTRPSGDSLLYNIIEKKRQKTIKVSELLEKISIYNSSNPNTLSEKKSSKKTNKPPKKLILNDSSDSSEIELLDY